MIHWMVVLLLAAGEAAPAADPGAKAMFDSGFPGSTRFASAKPADGSRRAAEVVPPDAESRGGAVAEIVSPRRPLGIRYWIRQVDARGAELGRVGTGHSFRRGDRIQLVMEANDEGYLAVVQKGADGRIGLLYPRTREQLSAGKLNALSPFLLPDEGHSFTFDDKAGEVRLWLVVTPSLADLRALPLRPEMTAADLYALTDLAAKEKGCKNLVIEAFEDPHSGPASYSVHREGGTIVQEILLAHR